MFLRVIAMTTHDLRLESTGASLWMGTGLLLLGVVVNVAASINCVRLVGRLQPRRRAQPALRARGAVALTLACLGLGWPAYLVLIR